jgi:hypothetical protein
MKCVDTIARIRREFFVQGKTIKEIVRDLHVSRNTVRKVVRSGATAFEYASNETKAARERLTLIRVFEELAGSRLRGRLRCGPALCPGWRREQASSSAAPSCR